MRLGLLIVFISLLSVQADTPAHCLFEQYLGTWTYSMSDNIFKKTVNCTRFSATSTYRITLKSPNIAIDQNGVVGNFTLVYDEGVEIHISGKKFFAFSAWSYVNGKPVSICNATIPGWYHNSDGTNWGCFIGTLTDAAYPTKTAPQLETVHNNDDAVYQAESALVEEINKHQTLWKAAVYSEFQGKTLKHMKMLGGVSTRQARPLLRSSSSSSSSAFFKASLNKPAYGSKSVGDLPLQFDWRNVSGLNYVSPVRNQGGCGSCYTFATTGMLEARIRVLTKNSMTPTLSPQSIVSCSQYSQGCSGGFNYLVSKYAEDFGILEEQCFPYLGSDSACNPKCSNGRLWSAINYYYVGGYYGACSEDLMKRELLDNGPMAISFEVENDFFQYKSGIYYHNKTAVRGFSVNPWEQTNHAVLLVGWGVEAGVPYWIVKNSWGPGWGENGFFRILRGVDECAIESMAVAATPILQ